MDAGDFSLVIAPSIDACECVHDVNARLFVRYDLTGAPAVELSEAVTADLAEVWDLKTKIGHPVSNQPSYHRTTVVGIPSCHRAASAAL